MMGIKFAFNGFSNSEYNLIVEKSNHRNKPKKRRELISIPGRTGDLIIEENSFENLNVTIECYLDARGPKSVKELLDEINMWLNDNKGYRTLVFNDGTILDAVFIGEIIDEPVMRRLKKIKLTFSCKPFEGEFYDPVNL